MGGESVMVPPVTNRMRKALLQARASGYRPAVIWLGRREYGELYQLLATQPDDRRPRRYLGVDVELVDKETLLKVGVR